MTMTYTNAQWESMDAELTKLIKEKITLPVCVSYAICRNRLTIERALDAYRMTRDDVIGTYSNGKGQITQQDDPELFDKVCQEIAVIAAIPVSLDITTIELSELMNCGQLPLHIVAALSFMIIE